MDYNPHKPKREEQMLIQFSDSESDEEIENDQGRKLDDAGEEDGDDDEGEDSDKETGRSTMVQLYGIHSGMTQQMLAKFISKHTQGLKEVGALSLDWVTIPPTQTMTLCYESQMAAQLAHPILSEMLLGPGGSKIKAEILKGKGIQSPADGEQPTVKGATGKTTKPRPRVRYRKPREKKQRKTQVSDGGDVDTTPSVSLEGNVPCGGLKKNSSLTLEVMNISIKKDEFQKLLTQLKIAFQNLFWKQQPKGSKFVLCFKKQEDMDAAQKILNNLSVGSARQKLAVKVVTPDPTGGKGLGKTSDGAASASEPPEKGPGKVSAVRSRTNYKRGDSGKRSSRGGHARVVGKQPGPDITNSRQPADRGPKQMQPGQSIPSLLELPLPKPADGQRYRSSVCNGDDDDDDERMSIVSVASNASASPLVKSIEVTNIDRRVNNEGFRHFLRGKGIPFKDLKFLTSKTQERYAIIYFDTTKQAAKSRKFLHGRWIFHRGPQMQANFSTTSLENDNLREDDANGRQKFPEVEGATGGPPQDHFQGGNRGRRGRGRRGRSQFRARSDADESDKFSETVSVSSRKSFTTSEYRGRHNKSSSLHITNIGKDCDQGELSGFLQSLDLQCECSEFRPSKMTDTQCAIIQFPDDKKAAEGKKVLDSDEWVLGDSPIKVSFSRCRETISRGGGGSSEMDLSQLESKDDSTQSSVRKWLEGTETSAGNCNDGSKGQRGRGHSKGGHTSRRVGHGRKDEGSKIEAPDEDEDGRQFPQGAERQTAEPPDQKLLLSEKAGYRNPHQLREKKQEPNPKKIVITDLPRDIAEEDVLDILTRENCKGFKDVRLLKNKDSRARTSECFVEFKEREYAMEAVLRLYGRLIHGHRCEVRLTVNHEQMEPAIARKTLTSFQEEEMPVKVKSIESAIEDKIETIGKEVQHLEETSEENLSFADLERCESSIAALEHQLDQQQRYLKEFQTACRNVELAVDSLRPRVVALSEVQKIRHRFERECRRAESPLPVYGYRSEVQETIQRNMALVLQGETGSGKSTQIPQYIVDMELQGQGNADDTTGQKWRVVCTQPRRVAALTLAKRVAEEYGCRVGEEVGYFVGNKKLVKDSTVVTFMTDRKLLNMCMADPDLLEYTCVIVDEAHERSVDTDILLATLKRLLGRRHDLHLVIMSATIDIKLFTTYLGGCAELSIPGRTFPVDKHWCGDDVGIGEGDYLKKAIQQAAKVHKNEDPGDILVFLTSANEIETACRDLKSTLGLNTTNNDGPVLILPLHGRLQPEDQMKVFAETREGQRKIVFATNVAETSVTIKGIKYVIDTGVVKECQYDPKRSMSLLKVTTVTRASAEQRAGRAGRTAPGVCFRLYTKEEYGELEEMMKPEILRVHLGMAALQLLELGVEDVENFDFIQAPDREATRQAMITLRLLGAIDEDKKLTALGKKMATLPLEPRLSKLVLEGAERGLATEAVALAALISAPGSVFYRGGSDKDKEKADRLKLQFCHESGDVITMLNAYIQWNNQPEKKQKSWSLENSMNSKTLRAVKETVKEVSQILKKEHSIDCDYSKAEEPDKVKSETLQKVIMSGYFQTLSLYNSHIRAGYTVLLQQKSAHVHPSSALKALGSNPTWIVYEEFKRTSRDFLFNVTPVDITWLQEVAPVFYEEINLESLQEMAMMELPPISLGTAVMRQLMVRRNAKLRALEEKITDLQQSPCVIEVNRSAKQLQMFVNKQCSSFATSYVQGFLEDERKTIERQQIEVPVGESGVIRQVVEAGAETRFILMAKDYRTLEISNMPADATEDEVESIIRFSGCSKEEILDVYRFPPHTSMAKASKWGRVTFVSPKAAEDAKQRLEAAAATEETQLTVRAMQGRGFQRPDVRRVNTRLVVVWYTWPSKGHAYVNCDSTENALQLRIELLGLQLRDMMVLCKGKRNDTRALLIESIHPDVSQEELEKAIRKRSQIPFTKCSIVRREPLGRIITPEEVTRDIFGMFDGVVQQNEMQIDILPVKSEKTQMHKAIVTFSGDSEGQVDARVAELQDNPRRNTQGQIYHLKITASCMLFCRPEVYSCLQEDINRLVETTRSEKEDLVIRINKSRKTSDQVISISSGKIEDVQTVRRSLLVYVQGETVPLSDVYRSEISYQKKSRVLEMLQKALRFLLQDLDAHAMIDTRRQAFVFFGNDQIRERLKRRFGDYVGIICNNMLREIPLAASVSPHCTKGRAIRALVKAYGPWLKALQDGSGATTVTMNTKQGVLLIEGDQEVFDKTHDMVNTCLSEAGLEDAMSVKADEQPVEDIECGICYTPVEGHDEVYRLSACSHGFHQECLSELFKVRLKDSSKDYPIECPSESCGRPMLLCDIRILCPEEDKRLRLYQLALEAHVAEQSEGKLKFCPTADCCMIYKHTDAAQTFVCPECRTRLCSSCGAEPHPSQTCGEFKISGKTFDDIEQWLKTGVNAKKCPVPNCGCYIEKISGCHHMTCKLCHKHICWVCLSFFDTDRQCYGHLQAVHGDFI